MSVFLKLLLVMALVNVIYLTGLLVACWVMRMPVEKVNVFLPPIWKRTRFAGVDFLFGLLPIYISVVIQGMEQDAEVRTGFASKSGFQRASISLGSVAAILLVAGMYLGFASVLPLLARGFHQVLLGAYAPLSQGQQMVGTFLTMLDEKTLTACIGLASVKYAALCLLPIPGQNLLNAVRDFVLKPGDKPGIQSCYGFIGVLANIYIFSAWLLAIVAGLLKHAEAKGETSSFATGIVAMLALLTAVTALDRAKQVKQQSSSRDDDSPTLPLAEEDSNSPMTEDEIRKAKLAKVEQEIDELKARIRARKGTG